MARARVFQTQALARMWEELRYAPPATLARMAADAEAFAALVQPLEAYPEQMVLERITRYRPDAAPESGVVVGLALMADLATFVEHATARSPLSPDARGGALTVAEAAAKLGVSRNTFDRYRARGLMCHHVRRQHAVELCVFQDALNEFITRNAKLVKRAGITGRLTHDARDAITARALQELAAGPASMQALAERLAPVSGRSSRTVRRVLELDPRINTKATRTSVRTLDDHAARHAARAWQMGVSPQQMADHEIASVAACTRAVQRGRALALRDAIACAHPLVLANFQRADSEATLLAPPSVRSGLPVGDLQIPLPRLASGRKSARHEKETAAVVAHHFLVWRSAVALKKSRRPDSPALDSAERDLRWAYRLRRAVVQAALPDALARVAQHLGSPWARLPQDLQARWVAMAARAVAEALDFRALASVTIDDVHPLSAAAMAVERMLTRADLDAQIAHTPAVLHAAVVAPWMAELDSGDRWIPFLPQVASQHAAIVSRRFGLDGLPPATMQELAQDIRGSAAAAQARLYAAMAEIRAAARVGTSAT